MSTFGGLEIGLRALETQRKSLDITGHNMANANNEHYNKQRAVQSATDPYTKPGLKTSFSNGQMGTGVEIENIERVKDNFINSQLASEKQSSAYWEQMNQGLERVEFILNEPSESGISTSIDEFWNAIQDLSNNPDDSAARNMVRENAKTMIDAFQSVDKQLADYQSSLDDNLSNAVDEINLTTSRIANLNNQIISVKGSNQNPNDLLDERDALYQELNELLNVQSREDELGNLIISTDGREIVNGADNYELKAEAGEGENQTEIVHSRSDDELKITGGKTAAMLQLRGEDEIGFYRAELEKLAEAIVGEFNQRHSSGYDSEGNQGANFFRDISQLEEGNRVAGLEISNQIQQEGGLSRIAAGNYSSDPAKLALENLSPDAAGDYSVDIKDNGQEFEITISELAGEQLDTITVEKGASTAFDSEQGTFVEPGQGDFDLTAKEPGSVEIGTTSFSGSGDNASYLADLFSGEEIIEGTTAEGYFRTIISTVGAESKRAQEMQSNQEAVIKQLTALDRSISGVSLDEEMANLIKYQQAYNSAAKYISKVDEILATLINMV